MGMIDMHYVPLSEARIVKALIMNRTRQLPDSCADTMTVARDIYLDLDMLIRGCGLTDTQNGVVQKLLVGYSPSDIADADGCRASTVHNHLNRAVEKIVMENNRRWRRVYANNIADMSKKCADGLV